MDNGQWTKDKEHRIIEDGQYRYIVYYLLSAIPYLLSAITYLLSVIVILFFFFGCRQSEQEQAPVGMITVPQSKAGKSYFMDISPVTVAQFDTFIKKSRYITDAEKFGNAGVMNMNG